MTVRVPMSSPDLTEAEVRAVHEVLSTRYLSLGPHLDSPELGCYTVTVNQTTRPPRGN